MTIERLETIAAGLYKEAEEATPIIGGADKLDWMARRLEDIIEGKTGSVDEYLNCETTDQVEALLEAEYNDFKDKDDDKDLLIDENGVVANENITEDGRVALSDTIADLNEDTIIREELYEDRLTDNTDEAPKRPEKETGIKDELPDPYAEDRPDQPEFIDNEPNYFEDQPVVIIEEEIIIVDDTSEGSQMKDSDFIDQSPACGDDKNA